MILEAIYEGSFEDTSHGFRPFRSCHSALVSIQHRFTGSRWFIEGDIKGFFDNIDHQILINTLRLRIEDERFLRLIWKFLRAGYLEVWKYNNTYSGTPQGGIISPILANIYLDQFDKYMVKYAEAFNKGKERKKNKAYSALNTRTVNKRKQWRAETDLQVKAQLFEDLKSMQKEKYKMQCSEQMDEDYRRIQYVRYADDFLIGIIGSKEECELIKKDITEFMRNELKLELSAEKTLITHAQENAKFLGFDITVRSLNTKKRNSKGILKREFSGKVMLNLSAETVKKKLMQYGAVRFTQGNGKEVWKPQARTPMVGMKVEDMVAQYDLEIRGFYNYYCIANNVSATCADFGYIMSYSLYMTVAQKLNSSVRQILFKYKKDKVFTVTYKDDKGNDRYRTLYNDGFKRRVPSKNAIYDRQPCTMYVPKATLAERLRTNVCELCGKEAPLIMHHVRTLKTVSSSTPWGKMMLNKHRKTVAVCEECFAKIKNEK